MFTFLLIEGKEYTIQKFSFKLHRGIDDRGLPNEHVQGSVIRLEIEIAPKESFFREWGTSPRLKKHGELIRKNDDFSTPILKFDNAYLVKYERTFNGVAGLLIANLSISAKKLFTDDWSVEHKC